jgi:hypothetical protein
MGLRIGKRKFDNRKTWALFITGGVLWFGLILAMGYYNIKEGDRKTSQLNSGSVSVNRNGEVAPADFNGIAIYAKVSQVSVERFTYVVHFAQFPQGVYVDDTGMSCLL